MTDEQQRTIPLSYVALPFAPDYVHDFIARSLQHRAEASESVRDALNSAIADSISVDGFKDASKASPHQLVDDVFHELVHGNRRLAAGVLRAWTESHEDLRDLVTRHLTESKMPADGPDLKERVFHSAWPRAEWLREIEAIVENRDDLDEEDVGMMLCCVSGRLPTAGDARAAIESPTLLGWLDRLRELPHDAPEWVDVEEFTEAVYRIADEKATERDSLQSEALAELLSGIRADFDAELRYLGIDLSSWEQKVDEVPWSVSGTLTLAKELRDNLARYRPIRPQADSRDAEAARAVERLERESEILDIVQTWEISETHPQDPDDEPPADGPDAPAEVESPTEEQPAPSDDAPDAVEPDPTVSKDEHEAALGELDRIRREGESLRAENARLAQSSSDLESDKRALDDERSDLKGELSRSRAMEETWRRSYVDARAAGTDAPSEPTQPPAGVNEAVALAEQSFPDRLVFALNSKSDRNSQFQKPNEVFEALAWLATVYHERRTSPGTRPDFDLLLRESCSGWSFKTGQTEVTTEQFDEWYSTTVDGKPYELGPHLGKGNSRDPKSTIRIAFAWDDERRRVIVGYIGRHQRNRRT